MGKRINIVGKKYNRLTVLSEIDTLRIECICDCGEKKNSTSLDRIDSEQNRNRSPFKRGEGMARY